ncbi:FtsX-like permease family protein [Streptosporangium sp. CA-135522]|uniref:FtsX-like permease family protein n=1 Tax=Streptosporangium sp. CA-135522 TaxID=3240072 RepID=UPI003D91324C
MLRLSMSTFSERWQLFVGGILSVAMGVALVQSSLLALVATGKPKIPPGVSKQAEESIREGYVGAATVLGMTAMLSWFLAVFVVASTFSFTVAQRRKDLALLRLVGGSRGQLVRLLLSESLLLGLIGTGAGTVLGLPAAWVQSRLLIALGFLPDGFSVGWQSWILLVSVAVGVGVALLGALTASWRAAKVGPLEALRETGAAARVMTFFRWCFGLSSLALSVWMVMVARSADLLGALVVAMTVSMTGAVALSQLSPLVVPLVGRLFGLVLRASTLGEIAQANLRDGVRRSASTAAPLIVLVAMLLGLSGTLGSLGRLIGEDLKRIVAGDLVVDSTGSNAERITAVPGVAVASVRVTVPMAVTATHHDEGRALRRTHYSGVVAVDAAAYRRTYRPAPRFGTLDRLHGRTIAVGPGMAGEGLRLGSTVSARIGARKLRLRIVAMLPATLENYADSFLVPRELIPAELVAGAPAQTVVQVVPGADPAAVAERIGAAGIGGVSTVSEWADARSAAEWRGNMGILAVLMGLAALYTLVAVINAVVIAGTERKAEFANARMTGLSRAQVVRMALIESWAVALIGVLLGCAVAAGALAGIGSSTVRAVGRPVVDIPWELLGILVVGAFVVTGATSVWTTLSATRSRPVTLISGKE